MVFPRNEFLEMIQQQNHSEEYISEISTYIDSLTSKNLPVIFDTKHLAGYLGESVVNFIDILESRDRKYKYFAIKKRRGGYRRIISPYTPIREIQLWVKTNILDQIPLQNCVTAFTHGRSIVTNANIHKGQKYIKKYDLKDFFESIDIKKVNLVFRYMGYDKVVAWNLARICTTKIDSYRLSMMEAKYHQWQDSFTILKNKAHPFLVQGAPTSPGVANLVYMHLDKRMQALANKLGINYSRYADDIIFSSVNKRSLPKDGLIKRILENEGFHLNDAKTKLLLPNQRQEVTGLLVDKRIRVPGKYKRDIYRHLHFCNKFGGRSHFQTVSPDKKYNQQWLYGRILFVNAVEPQEAKKMKVLFEQIDWNK